MTFYYLHYCWRTLKKFILNPDVSNFLVGHTLIQLSENGHEQPIFFGEKKLKAVERNYTVTKTEALTIVHAIKTHYHLLEGQSFEMHTDHQPLIHRFNVSDKTGRFLLQQFDFTIKYKTRIKNSGADGLSRLPYINNRLQDDQNKLPSFRFLQALYGRM